MDEDPQTAKEAWDLLAAIFQDNKSIRSLALKAELRILKLGDLSIDAYFRKIESIANVLKGLESPMSDEDIMNTAYEGLRTKKLFKTLSLDESRSPEYNLFSDLEENSEEEVAETMAETMEQYMSKTRADYGSGIARPKIDDKDHFELKGQFLKELRDNTFSGSDHEDANEHIEKVLEIVDLFHVPNITQDQIMLRVFPMSLTGAASHWLRNKPSGSIKSWEDLKTKFLSKTRSTKTSDGLVAIQTQLNNYGREIKKVYEKFYAAQVGCEQCKGPHYTKDCSIKEEAAALGFYQRNNANPSYQERRQSMEESLRKFMSESAKRHEENSNLIKEIRASTDAAIRNQGASIKTFEIQIGQMSKVLQERGFGSLPSSTKTNPRDHVKSISTTVEVDMTLIRRIDRLNDYYCDDKKELYRPQFLEANSYGASHIDNSIPRKEKDPGSFTLPCYINNLCFDNSLADLGASVNRTVKYPKGIAENVLVWIGKFVFPVDFILLDMPEDVKVPLILKRPFSSTAHAKIDMFKRNITLRVGDEKNIFKSINPTSSLIKRVYMLGLKERMELDLEARLMGEAFVRDQDDDLMPTIEEGEDKVEYKGKNVVRAFMNVPIFVRNFSVVTHFVVVENMDGYRDQDMGDVIFREPFYEALCVEARRFDGLITIHNGNDSVTYQMVRSHPRFKHLSNVECNKIKPLLKVSVHDKLNELKQSIQKLEVSTRIFLILGPIFRDAEIERMTHTNRHIRCIDEVEGSERKS
ncbi:DNA-directed DNA polymerase [Tanacetum coccineum]|uniref:DNA-directed DNA polymerase n=1 Tax=Tanacetum coccineum TaxID=301880 RepID=A0ABQ5E3I2_9ASTR